MLRWLCQWEARAALIKLCLCDVISEAVGSYAENQRITAVRRVYQRGCVNPMINIEQLWRDYSKYEEVKRLMTTQTFGGAVLEHVVWPLCVFMYRASTYTWPKRWSRTAAETTWTPGESLKWDHLTDRVSWLSTDPSNLNLTGVLCVYRSMRLWWRVWTGTPRRYHHRTPPRRPSRWTCGRSTSSGRRATHCAQKTKHWSQREVNTYSQLWWGGTLMGQVHWDWLLLPLVTPGQNKSGWKYIYEWVVVHKSIR